jgi:hypothetical protein
MSPDPEGRHRAQPTSPRVGQLEPVEQAQHLLVAAQVQRFRRVPVKLNCLAQPSGVAVGGDMGERKVAAGREPVPVPSHHAHRSPGIRDEVQHQQHQQADRLIGIQQALGLRVLKDVLDVAQVRLDHRGPVVAPKQQLAMRDRDRLPIDVHDPALGVGSLGDLVHITDGRDARADVEELTDSGLDHEENSSAQERPVHPGGVPYRWHDLVDLVAHDAVGRKVVGAIQPVVVHPSRIGHDRVDVIRYPVRVLSHRSPRHPQSARSSLGDHGDPRPSPRTAAVCCRSTSFGYGLRPTPA